MSLTKELGALETKIVSRIRDLEAATNELHELREIAKRLGLDTRAKRNGPVATPAKRAQKRTRSTPASNGKTAGRHTASARSAPTPRRAGATPARRSRRAEEVLALVSARPGIKVSELGKELKVDPTSLYSVVRRLESDTRIRKDGPQLHPAV
jgi:hypothetical protein